MPYKTYPDHVRSKTIRRTLGALGAVAVFLWVCLGFELHLDGMRYAREQAFYASIIASSEDPFWIIYAKPHRFSAAPIGMVTDQAQRKRAILSFGERDLLETLYYSILGE